VCKSRIFLWLQPFGTHRMGTTWVPFGMVLGYHMGTTWVPCGYHVGTKAVHTLDNARLIFGYMADSSAKKDFFLYTHQGFFLYISAQSSHGHS
jgi:hypothetical protein